MDIRCYLSTESRVGIQQDNGAYDEETNRGAFEEKDKTTEEENDVNMIRYKVKEEEEELVEKKNEEKEENNLSMFCKSTTPSSEN